LKPSSLCSRGDWAALMRRAFGYDLLAWCVVTIAGSLAREGETSGYLAALLQRVRVPSR